MKPNFFVSCKIMWALLMPFLTGLALIQLLILAVIVFSKVSLPTYFYSNDFHILILFLGLPPVAYYVLLRLSKTEFSNEKISFMHNNKAVDKISGIDTISIYTSWGWRFFILSPLFIPILTSTINDPLIILITFLAMFLYLALSFHWMLCQKNTGRWIRMEKIS